MLQLNHIYSSPSELGAFLSSSGVDMQSEKILIQMFSSVSDKTLLSNSAAAIVKLLPNATLIGCTTAGEIIDGEMVEKKTVLSISVFESVSIISGYAKNADSRSLGKALAKTLLVDDARCVICFADGLNHNSDDFLNALHSENRADTPIAGGMAGDLFRFETTYTIYRDDVFEGGAVGVALIGNDLEVFQDYNVGWRPVGPELTITRSQKNRVFEIDGRPILEVYTEALGEEVVTSLPSSAIGFPLIKKSGETLIARSMVAALDDGSILFAGNLYEGEKVQFGIGSTTLVNNYRPSATVDLQGKTLQAAFIYSCSARKQFLGKQLEFSLSQITAMAPALGFFTYGEFYFSQRHPMLLNITTTILFLREKQSKQYKTVKRTQSKKSSLKEIANKGLFHLIDYTTKTLADKSSSLASAEKSLAQHFDAINNVLIVSKTDTKGIITYANENFERISGYRKDELLGRSHNIIRNPDTPDTVFEALWSTIQKGEIWHGSFANMRKDGSTYYVKSSIIPLYDRANQIVEYMAIREDITDLIESQKAYKREHAFSQMLYDNEESIIVVIKNRVTQRINQAFFRLFPYRDFDNFQQFHRCVNALFISREGFLSRGDSSFPWFEKILASPGTIHKVLMKDKYGTERTFSVKAKRVQFEEDHYVICTFNDVTELEEARVQAEAAEEAQAKFLANMSHEIRTPMNGILGFTALMKKTDLTPHQKELLDIIDSSSGTLLSIINDILDFSKIKNNHIVLEQINTDLFVELHHVFNLMGPIAKQKSIDYSISLDPRTHVNVITDPTRLKQVIINLLSNAIKFTPSNGKVLLKTELLDEKAHESQTIRFTVEDTGIGIPTAKQKSIFDAFEQAHHSTTREYGGTGLGLSISSTLVKALGGELKLQSEEGDGACFFFDLTFNLFVDAAVPAEKGAEPSTHALADKPDIDQNLKILIAEDNEVNRIFMQLTLAEYGLVPVFAENGETAIEKVKHEAFDIILMDVNMPVMNGLDATKHIRNELMDHTPIIALTANALETEKEKMLESGMDGHLTKPLEIEALEKVLQQYS